MRRSAFIVFALVLGCVLLSRHAGAIDGPHDDNGSTGGGTPFDCNTCHVLHNGWGSLLDPIKGGADPCAADTCAAGEHRRSYSLAGAQCDTDQTCVSNPCGTNYDCSEHDGVTACNCRLGFSTGCSSCQSGFTGPTSGTCNAVVCDAGTVGQSCGFGSCAGSGGGGCGTDCASGSEHNRQTDGVCVADETCAPNPCTGNEVCTATKAITGGEAVCNCPVGFSNGGAGCSTCDSGFTGPSGGACTGKVCNSGTVGQECGYGTCVTSGGNCTTDCTGQNHNEQSTGTCVGDETCNPNPCSGNQLCDDTKALTGGEAICNCPIGFSNGATCTTCDAGFTGPAGGVCTARVCGAGTVGQDCGYGTCAADAGNCSPNCASGTEHNRQTDGVCVADEACSPNPCTGNQVCTNTKAITGGEAVCNCPIGFSDGATCSTCDQGFTGPVGGVCTARVCGAGTVGQDCGYGTCASSPGSCTADCASGSEHNRQTDGVCVADQTCAGNPCPSNNYECVDTKVTTGGERTCNCKLGFSDGATSCSTCDPGFTLVGNACVPKQCDAGNTNGGACGYGTCAITGGSPGEFQICSNDSAAQGGSCTSATCTANGNPSTIQGLVGTDCAIKGINKQTASVQITHVFNTQSSTGTLFKIWMRVSPNSFGYDYNCTLTNTGGSTSFSFTDSGLMSGTYGGGTCTADTYCWAAAFGNSTIALNNGAHTLSCSISFNDRNASAGFDGIIYTTDTSYVPASATQCSSGGSLCTTDADFTAGTCCPTPSGNSPWGPNNYSSGSPTYLCSCDSAAYSKTGETCDTCASGYVNVNGICLSNPCSGQTCSGQGSCYVDPSAPGNARCNCDGTYSGATPLACNVCNALDYNCTADSGAYVVTGGKADTCASGFTNVNGVCLSDPCAGQACSSQGSCYVDPAVAGNAVCNCDGTYWGATPLACDQCSAVAGYTCTPDSAAYVVTGGKADTCASGYVNVNGVCVSDPCAGQTCSGQGTCIVDPSVAGNALCNCNGTYFGLTPLTCDQCSTGASYTCSCDSAAYVTGGTETCDTCAGGYVNVNGVCLPNPCSGQTCSGQGSCYVDPAVAGNAVCNCDGTYFGLAATTCDQCSSSGSYTCNCPAGTAKSGGSETCDTCASGYVNLNGSCISPADPSYPCYGETCSGHGTCYVASSGNAACDCSGDYYGLTTTSCDQCAGGAPPTADQRTENLCRSCHISSGTAPEVSSHRCDTANGCNNTFFMTCTRCHDPHSQDQNTLHGSSYGKFVKDPVLTPNSGPRQVIFLGTTGANSFADDDATLDGICQVCHTQTTRHKNSGARTAADHNAGADCMSCHPHTETDNGYGFKGAGESSGNSDCVGCHSYGMAVSETATKGNTYHHVMEAGAVIGVSPAVTQYPTSATPTTATGDNDKTCVQCHADHDVFRTDLNPQNTIGRGANLRTRISQAPVAGQAPNDTSGYYSNADFLSGSSGGICLTCHQNVQTKNTADQASDGSSSTPAISVADFGSSSHAYTVAGQFTQDSSAVTVACTKCHNSNTSTSYQNGTVPRRFALHTSPDRKLRALLGMTPADNLEENFCYRCHSLSSETPPGGGTTKSTANMDYYGVAAMSGPSQGIFAAAQQTFAHPVGTYSGRHDSSEGASANDGTLSGTERHAECSDCHNAHAAQANNHAAGAVTAYGAGTPDTLTDNTKSWTAYEWAGYAVKIVSGTGAGQISAIYSNTATQLRVEFATAPNTTSRYVIFKLGYRDSGNEVSGAMVGTWGLNPTWPTPPSPPNWNDGPTGFATTAAEITSQFTSPSAYGRTATPATQGGICIKCHSGYAYGSSPPDTPSGGPNSLDGSTWNNTVGPTTPQSDVANQFNPNNLGHHAIFARGNNQPLVSSASTTSTYNLNWPKFTSGTVSTSGTTVTFSSAIPATVLPGWFIYVGNSSPAQGVAGWYEVASVNSATVVQLDRTAGNQSGQPFMLTAGLGNNFVPPWGPWSTLKCTDCHTSDTSTDPFGPHGSGSKWLLKRAVTQKFAFWNGSSVLDITATPTDSDNTCVNCHRRDVYGDYGFLSPTYNTYPRQEHPIDLGKNHSLKAGYKPKWGIICMNCHGGSRIGGIHGSNLGKGAGGTAGSYSGKRLLNGSNWYAVTRSSTTAAGACWTKGADDVVDSCSTGHANKPFLSGASGKATYDYDSNP